MVEGKKLTRAEQKLLRPIQILDAAFEEFVKNGYAATRLEDIAERVGVTKGTIYVYFATKEVLFEETIRHVFAPFTEVMTLSDDPSKDPVSKLVDVLGKLHQYIYRDRRNREVLRLVISEGARFPDIIARHEKQFIEPVVARIDALLAEGVAAGRFRPKPAAFAQLAVAPILTLTVLQLIFDERKDIDEAAYVEAYLDLLLHGLLV